MNAQTANSGFEGGRELTSMQILSEKLKQVLASVFETMEIDPGTAKNNAFAAEEYEEGKDRELNTDAHHSFIEPCW